jgi:hypothetical protein
MNAGANAKEIQHFCGSAVIAPAHAVAGAFGTWQVTYTAGAYGLDIGARLRLAFRLASDWGPLQTGDPSGPGYVTIECRPARSGVRAQFDPRGHTRPWSQALLVDITEESIAPGDQLIISLGDRRGGSPGCRAQTFVEHPFRFVLFADPLGTGEFVGLPDILGIEVAAGPAARLCAIAPSTVGSNARFPVTVKAEDAHGNPAVGYRGTVEFPAWTGLAPYTFAPDDEGVHRFVVTAPAGGILRVDVADRAAGTAAVSNPIVVGPSVARLYWGDIHGQTQETVGTGPVAEYFPFARRYGALDFCAHCGNDFELTDETFEALRAAVRQHHEPRAFITFLSYEWSGNTPTGGDHNVYFLDEAEQIHRSSSWRLPGRPFHHTTDRFPLAALYEEYRGREDVLIIPHIGGRRADLAVLDPRLSPFLEVASVHGWFEWFAREALERGLRAGFVAGSDDHTGRPGASYPAGSGFGVRGGLLAAWAEDLTREALWKAFRTRRVYGTTGERIVVDFHLNGHPMGAECRVHGAVELDVEVAGTAGIERLEVWRGTDLWRVESPRPCDPASGALAITWSGARSKDRRRRLGWDCGAALDRGRIVGAVPTGFGQAPVDDLAVRPRDVRWRSYTWGNAGRVVLTLDAPPDARMTVRAGDWLTTFALREIGDVPCRWALPHGIDCEVSVHWLPVQPYPTELRRSIIDTAPPLGDVPYWVRVIQEDGGRAWSSPVFVTVVNRAVPRRR